MFTSGQIFALLRNKLRVVDVQVICRALGLNDARHCQDCMHLLGVIPISKQFQWANYQAAALKQALNQFTVRDAFS